MESLHANLTPLHAAGRTRGMPVPSETERLAEVSPVLLASADADLRFEFVNGAWERLLGWLPEELAGRPTEILLHPEERNMVVEVFRGAREIAPAEIDFDCRMKTRDGRWRWVSWKVRFEGGRWYGAGQDTTERRIQERELAASRARLAEVQRIAGVGGFDMDVLSGLIWWSEEHYRIFGVSPETHTPTIESGMSFVHPDDAERVRQAWDSLAVSGLTDGEIEYRIIRPDGAVRDLRVTARIDYDDAGRPLRIAGTAQDVTDQRRSERALAVQQARLRALVEQVPAIVYTAGLGSDAPWDYVSPQIETLLGYSAEEWAAGRELWWDALHPDDRAQAMADEAQIAGPGDRLRSEYRLRRRDGAFVWVRDEATAIENEHGELRLQGVLLDITERKLVEAAARQKDAQLQAIIDNSPLLIWAKDRDHRYLSPTRSTTGSSGRPKAAR